MGSSPIMEAGGSVPGTAVGRSCWPAVSFLLAGRPDRPPSGLQRARHGHRVAGLAGHLVCGHRTIKWLVQDDHRRIAWDRYGIEVVVEASRVFRREEMIEQSTGGRIVVLMTGDLRGEPPDLTLVLGVNDSAYRLGMTVLWAAARRGDAVGPAETG